MKNMISLKFNSWAKHQPRKDYKRHHWFALSNDFHLDSKLGDFSNEEKLCLIFLLCEASRQNKQGKVEIFVDHWCRVVGVTSKILTQALEKIESVQIAYRICTESERYITEQNITEHNRTEQNTFASSDEKSLSHPKAYESIVDVFNQRDVKSSTTTLWQDAYPDSEWVIQEIKKALAWEGGNPRRKKKDFARFMTNWLNNGWDRRRIDAPRQQTNKGLRPSTERTNDLDAEIFGDKK